MPQPIATWNPARGVWEVPNSESLICGHSELFSETWPTSGMTRGGSAYELPTSAPRTDGSESSLLPRMATPGPSGDENSTGTEALLRTPTAQLAVNGGSQHPEKRKAGGHGPTLADEIEHLLLPTPTSRDGKGPNQRGDDTCLHGALLPTPRATDGTKGGPNQRGSSGDLMLPSAVMLLPTPTARDSQASGGSTPSDVTLTDAVVRTSLGATTNPRFEES